MRMCIVSNNLFVSLYCIVFIHFYSASHSLSFSEALPTTAIDTVHVGVYTPKRYRQLQVKDLPKVPTWRLESAGFEPTTLRSNGVVSTNAPPCPILSLPVYMFNEYGYDCIDLCIYVIYTLKFA